MRDKLITRNGQTIEIDSMIEAVEAVNQVREVAGKPGFRSGKLTNRCA